MALSDLAECDGITIDSSETLAETTRRETLISHVKVSVSRKIIYSRTTRGKIQTHTCSCSNTHTEDEHLDVHL